MRPGCAAGSVWINGGAPPDARLPGGAKRNERASGRSSATPGSRPPPKEVRHDHVLGGDRWPTTHIRRTDGSAIVGFVRLAHGLADGGNLTQAGHGGDRPPTSTPPAFAPSWRSRGGRELTADFASSASWSRCCRTGAPWPTRCASGRGASRRRSPGRARRRHELVKPLDTRGSGRASASAASRWSMRLSPGKSGARTPQR